MKLLSITFFSTSLFATPILYTNGNIYLSFTPTVKTATWMLVDAGRIQKTGSGNLPKHIPQSVDLKGKTVFPGLIDAHAHLLDIGKAKWEVELRGTKSPEEAAERVKLFIAQHKLPEGTTVIGQNWDQDDWPEKKYPHRSVLDSVSSRHPIVLYRVDGHAAWLNTLALQKSDLWKTKQDPKGGKIFRDKRTEPTGILIDSAMDKLDSLLKNLNAEEVTKYSSEAIRQAHALGITGIHDAGIRKEDAAVIRKVVQTLPFRYYGMLSASNPTKLKTWLNAGPILSAENDRFALRTVKLYIDGAMGSRGAAFDLPYNDDPANSGLLMMSEKELTEKIRAIDKAGFQVAIHAIGSKGNRIAINAMEKALGKTCAAKRPRLEHAQVLTQEEIARMVKLGIVASMQPTHATSDMKWVFDRIGEERARYAYAWKSVLTANIPLAFGSDAPVELLNPWHGLYSAITRQDPSGLPKDGFLPQERIGLADALSAFTTGAHFAGFHESSMGELRDNLAADFIVLKKNPFEISAKELRAMEVEATYVAGERVYPLEPEIHS